MTAREFCRTPSMRGHGASPLAPGDLSATRAAAATGPGARVLTSKGERMRRLARPARWPVRSSGYRNDSLIVPTAAADHWPDELIDGRRSRDPGTVRGSRRTGRGRKSGESARGRPPGCSSLTSPIRQTQCTGNPNYQGNQHDDPASPTSDCRSTKVGTDEVRAAELQLLTSKPVVEGATRSD